MVATRNGCDQCYSVTTHKLCASVTKQYNSVTADGQWRSLTGNVTAGLAESKGSLPPGEWLQLTCGLTSCTPGSAPGPTLGNKYERTLPFSNNNGEHQRSLNHVFTIFMYLQPWELMEQL